MQVSSQMKDPRFSAVISSGGDHLVDTKTAAKVLGLRNHHTLEVWRSTKRYPQLCYHRVGRAIRYRAADLEAFLAASLVGSREAICSGNSKLVKVGGDHGGR